MTKAIDQHTAKASRYSSDLPRTVRRAELKTMVPLADSTIYEMERRGDFPRRFALSPRCVVWDLAEVEAWLAQRRQERQAALATVQHPDVRLRRMRRPDLRQSRRQQRLTPRPRQGRNAPIAEIRINFFGTCRRTLVMLLPGD